VAGIRMPVGLRPLDKIGGSGTKPKDDWDDDEA
jgi:hypothetical protein